MGGQGREALTMQEPNENISFKREKGCFLSTCSIFVIFLCFLGIIVATGLLVYYFASKPHAVSKDEYDVIPHPRKNAEAEAKTLQAGVLSHSNHRESHPQMKDETKEMVPKKKKVMDVRLPRSLKPLHYQVKLVPFINGNFSIHGHSEMTFEVLENTWNVTMHINGIITHNQTVRLIAANDMKGAGIPIQKHMYDIDRQFYVALLNEDLKAGMKYVISMDFTGFLNDNMNGFYRSSYNDQHGKKKWIAATQFQASDARKAFPCLDEPGLKANFTIELARERSMTSISNMPLRETVDMEGMPNWVWDKFETSVPMSTYLVAFIISDFKFKKTSVDNRYEFKVWAREAALYQTDYSLKVGPPASKFFEDFFNVPYPLPKQDMVALPDFSAGAMENWGLITYRETAMLFDPKISTASNKERVGTVIAHELAHQWFGNIVTPAWWNDLWLNEGFASYMEFVALNAVEPTFNMMEQFVIDDLHSAFALDCLETSHPISVEVHHPDQISEIFDRISYAKGASIIRMMHFFLGENTFRTGLSKYLTGLAYSSAVQDDLWHYLTEQAMIDNSLPRELTVKTIMDTWTLQMGFPVVTVTRRNDGTVLLKQERFLLEKNLNSTDKHDYKWWVPITYASKSNPDFKATSPREWMKPSETTKVLSGVPTNEWVIFNVKQAGYYRVNYDHANWNAIIDQLIDDHRVISTINRAQILNDALTLARAGMLPYEIAMKVFSYLKNEEEFVPWKAALNGLGFISNMLSHTGANGALDRFILDLTTPLYNKIGFADRVTDPHLEQRKRATILSQVCGKGYQPCVQEAISLYKKWMMNPDNDTIVSPNLKSVVYCTAIKNGGYEEWKFAWDKYQKANVASEKQTILSALGCTKESWIQSGYLQKSLVSDKGIRKQDVRSVIGSVAYTDHGRIVAWEFFKDKYNEIYKISLNEDTVPDDWNKANVSPIFKMGDKTYPENYRPISLTSVVCKMFGDGAFTLDSIVKTVTYNLNTQQQLKELRSFQREYDGKFGSAERAVKQSIETTDNNLRWMNNHYTTILNWLSNNGYENRIL